MKHKKIDMNSILNIVLVILVIILGFLLYKNLMTNTWLVDSFSKIVAVEDLDLQDSSSFSSGVKPISYRVIPAGLGSPERELILLSRTGITDEVEERYYELIDEVSESVTEINIATCDSIRPLVANIRLGTQIMINNIDQAAHTLKMGNGKEYTVEPGGSITVGEELTEGVYEFECDEINGVVVFIAVTG